MQNKKHILVIRMSAMGDVAMTIPVIKTLIAQNPNIRVTIVSKGFLKPLFEGIENVSFFTAETDGRHKGSAGIYRLHKELKALNIDVVADLHNVIRSKVIRTFFRVKGVPVAAINKGREEKRALTKLKNKVFKPLKSTHQRYVSVFEALGFKIDLSVPSVLENKLLSDELKDLIKYKKNENLIGIAPFAAHEGKKYPLELMEDVIRSISENYKVLLFGGGKKEVEMLTAVSEKYKNTLCIAGKINLKQELDIISNLSVMVSMDSGNGHFSAMFNVPTITLWGATHPYAGFVPFGQDKNCICADRSQYPLLPTSVYGNKVIPGYEYVMHSIAPKTIINKILSVLKEDC